MSPFGPPFLQQFLVLFLPDSHFTKPNIECNAWQDGRMGWLNWHGPVWNVICHSNSTFPLLMHWKASLAWLQMFLVVQKNIGKFVGLLSILNTLPSKAAAPLHFTPVVKSIRFVHYCSTILVSTTPPRNIHYNFCQVVMHGHNKILLFFIFHNVYTEKSVFIPKCLEYYYQLHHQILFRWHKDPKIYIVSRGQNLNNYLFICEPKWHNDNLSHRNSRRGGPQSSLWITPKGTYTSTWLPVDLKVHILILKTLSHPQIWLYR